jgi:hydroxylamine dehydrogenase
MVRAAILVMGISLLISVPAAADSEAPLSPATEECLDCHASLHPGIVEDWKRSRHAAVTPTAALQISAEARRMSAEAVPAPLGDVAVGCAECHSLRPEAHADTFDHNGHDIHVVVSPEDCRTCHPVEVTQYADNLMSHAYGNLVDNPVYQQLQQSIVDIPVPGPDSQELVVAPADEDTQAEACLYCHGTRLAVTGTEVRDTDAGELEFPVIAGWPNQGVGRLNLDGSRGSCSACHTRHRYSIEMARKPHTCRECHIGPDVPAYKVYAASKHGNIYSAHNRDWDMTAVPWTIGQDFGAPTCAVCHISQLVNTDGEEVAARSHTMTNRLGWRLFGLVYAHPQPKNPDTTIIRNADGLPLPTDFNGRPAMDFLIDEKERRSRNEQMQAICRSCHDTSWVTAHFRRLDNTVATTNTATRTGTAIMADIWQQGLAKGLAAGGNPFDEAVEKRWSDLWLFYANTIRYASAMAGGGDYGVYADGRYHLVKGIRELDDWRRLHGKPGAR